MNHTVLLKLFLLLFIALSATAVPVLAEEEEVPVETEEVIIEENDQEAEEEVPTEEIIIEEEMKEEEEEPLATADVSDALIEETTPVVEELVPEEDIKPVVTPALVKPCVTGAKNVTDGIQISWNKVDNASGYQIYRKKDNGSFTLIRTASVSETSFTDTSVNTTLATYTYHVTPTGNASQALINDVSVFRQYVTPCTIASLSLNNRTGITAVISQKDAHGYQIQYASKSNFSDVTTVNSASSTTTLHSFLQNTKYYFRIRAYKNYGGKTYYGTWSDVSSIKTASAKPSVKLFRQTDRRWSSKEYRARNGVVYSFGATGCVPTACANAISGLLGRTVSPVEVGNWLYNNTNEFGTIMHGGSALAFKHAAKHWGLNVTPIGSRSAMNNALKRGMIILGCVRTGYRKGSGLGRKFTHAITFAGYKNGKTTVYDGKKFSFSTKKIWNSRSVNSYDKRGGYVFYAVSR